MEKKSAPDLVPWGDGRLGVVLSYAFEAFGVRGHVDARKVGEAIGVTPGTVRRWVREKLPERRRADIERLILPTADALEQEERERAYAVEALADIYGRGRPTLEAWKEQGWLEPHVLAVVQLPRLRVCVARIARVDGDQKSRERIRAGGGVIVDQDIFPNRFAAQVAKAQLLEQLRAWRVVIPHGYVSRGRTESWLEEAPRPTVSWLVDNAPVKQPARRSRRRSSVSKPKAATP